MQVVSDLCERKAMLVEGQHEYLRESIDSLRVSAQSAGSLSQT